MIYTVLFHEANCVALLETLLYHQNSCESLGDVVLDLIDYCAQAIAQLIGLINDDYLIGKEYDATTETPAEEIERQKRDLHYKIGMKCLTILSYVVDRLPSLMLSSTTRMVKTHDVPCLLSEILHLKPWMKRCKGFEKYLDEKWTKVYGDDILKVTKNEAQTWFCLYKLLFNETAMRNYEINEFRQRELAKISGLLNEQILDQLPNLIDLKQFLCSFQIGRGPGSKDYSNLILEEIPEIKDNLMDKARRIGWKLIVDDHRRLFIDIEQKDIFEMAKR
jgi:hypothetical protein